MPEPRYNGCMRSLLFVTCCLLAAFSVAQPEDLATRKQVERFYAAWDRNMERENLAGIVKLFRPEGYSVDLEGRRTPFTSFGNTFRGFFANARKIESNISVQQAQRNGDEIVAWVLVESIFEIKRNGRWRKERYINRYAETLKDFGRGLQIVWTQEIPTGTVQTGEAGGVGDG